MSRRSAVVLLSGGLDSATVLALAIKEGFETNAITFDYGQSHSIELEAAARVAEHFRVNRHLIVEIDAGVFGGALLAGGDKRIGPSEAPATYVPARNTLFLSYALGWAESLDASDIFIGPNADDASGYPDCRSEYLRAFETVANLGTHAGLHGNITIHAPLIDRSKKEVLGMAKQLDVPIDLTWSCYFPVEDEFPCGSCDACRLRIGAEP